MNFFFDCLYPFPDVVAVAPLELEFLAAATTARGRWSPPAEPADAAAGAQLSLSRHNRDLRPCLKQKTSLRMSHFLPAADKVCRSISDTFLPMKYSSSRPFQVLSHSFCLVTLVVPHSSTSRSRLTDEAGLLRRRRRIISSPFFLRRKVSPLIT